MKAETRKLLEEVNEAHDWAEGQCHGGSGTQLSSIDICRVCSLFRFWFNDRQNGIEDRYTFKDGENGQELSLRQVVKRGCNP